MDGILGLFGSLFGLLIIGLILAVYFLPTIVAYKKKKANFTAILLLNLFLGWSLIAWVVSLVWATSHDASPQQVVIHNQVNTPPEKETINE